MSSTPHNYSPKRDLQTARIKAQSSDKVIPELKFAFWQHIFTSRHDQRLWHSQLFRVMPNLDATQQVSSLRQALYSEVAVVRKLRNRIAHLEPIFTRQVADDYRRVLALAGYRCKVTAAWLNENQQAVSIIALKS